MANERTYDDEYIFKILKEMQDIPELITPFRDKIERYDCGVQTVAAPSTVNASSQTLAKRLCHKANQTTVPRRNLNDVGCQAGNQLETKHVGCQFSDKVLKCINHVGNNSTKDLSALKMTQPVYNSSVLLKQLKTEDYSSKDFGCQFSNEVESNVGACKKDVTAKSFQDFGCQFGITNDPSTKQYETKEVGCQYSNNLRLDVAGTEEISRHHKEYKEIGLQCTQNTVEIGTVTLKLEQSNAETQTCQKISCIEVTRTSKPPTMKQALAVLKRGNINITITRGKVVKYSRNPPPAAPRPINQKLFKTLMCKLNEVINSRPIMPRSYDSDNEFQSIDSGYNLSDCETSSTRTQATNLSMFNESTKDRMENLFGIEEDEESTSFKTYSDKESIAESEMERVFDEMRSTSPLSVLPDSPPKKRPASKANATDETHVKQRKLQSSSLVANRKLSEITKRFKTTQLSARSELVSGDAVEVPTKKRIAHNVATLKITPPIIPETKPEIINDNPLEIQPAAIQKEVRKFKKPVAYQKRLQNKIESPRIVENGNMTENQIVSCAATNEDKLTENSGISINVETETAHANSFIVNQTEREQTVESQNVPNVIEAKEVCIRPETSGVEISTELNTEESNPEILNEERINDNPIVEKKIPWSKAKKYLRRLVFYQGNDLKTDNAVKTFQGLDQKVLINYILTAVRIDESEAAKGESPFEPCLTMTQKVMIGFLVKLENDDYPNITEDFLVLCERNLLFVEADATHVMRITKVYAALCKMKKQKMRLRRMMCDAMYQMGDLAVPFIHHVLVCWIQILVVISDEQQLKDKPLIQVLIQLVHTKTCHSPEYFLSVLKNLLEVYYKYPRERYNENNLIKDFLQQFMCTLREDFSVAITILCKIKSNAWAFKQVELIQELINVAKHGSRDIVNALIGLIRKIQVQMSDDQKTYAKINEILASAETEISVMETEMLDPEDA
ncbi:PREDICTED: uncharacterized protein LOC108559716 isoform X2 [Nicrophorus vespilloides]|nr:PREDICTED: uncharacterized protein LOC108559716 isoform X2 [Nicrophorus vespilloides]